MTKKRERQEADEAGVDIAGEKRPDVECFDPFENHFRSQNLRDDFLKSLEEHGYAGEF